MLRLPRFVYRSPVSVAEALAMKADAGPSGAFVAGGTDLYPNMKRRHQTPAVVIGLARLRELRGLRFSDEGVSIGAGTLLSDVENDPRIRHDWPGLAHAIAEISTPPAAQHGDDRRQPAARYAVQLLRPVPRVAPGDRLLHEEGRKDLLGGAGLAQVPGRSVGGLGPRPDRDGRAALVFRAASGQREVARRRPLPQRRDRLRDEASRRAADRGLRARCRQLAGGLQEAAPARRIRLSGPLRGGGSSRGSRGGSSRPGSSSAASPRPLCGSRSPRGCWPDGAWTRTRSGRRPRRPPALRAPWTTRIFRFSGARR